MKKIFAATIITYKSDTPALAHEIGRKHAIWEHWEIIASIGIVVALTIFAIRRSDTRNSPKRK